MTTPAVPQCYLTSDPEKPYKKDMDNRTDADAIESLRSFAVSRLADDSDAQFAGFAHMCTCARTTTLMTYECSGWCMFTFQRGTGTMTFVADASDMYGFRSGPNSPGAQYWECVSMIEDVISHWDADKMVRSDTIGVGV